MSTMPNRSRRSTGETRQTRSEPVIADRLACASETLHRHVLVRRHLEDPELRLDERRQRTIRVEDDHVQVKLALVGRWVREVEPGRVVVADVEPRLIG